MVVAPGPGVAAGLVWVVRVPTQVREEEVAVVVLANMMGPDMVLALARARALAILVEIVTVDLTLMLVVTVVAAAVVKLEVIMDLVVPGLVEALDLALAVLRHITCGVMLMQVQTATAMAEALVEAKMVGTVVVKVMDLGTVMHIRKSSFV